MTDYDSRILGRHRQRQQQADTGKVKVSRFDADAGGWVLNQQGKELQLKPLSNGAIALNQLATRKNDGFKVLPSISPQPVIELIQDDQAQEFAALLRKATQANVGNSRVETIEYWIVTRSKEYKIAEYDRDFAWQLNPLQETDALYPAAPVPGKPWLNLSASYSGLPPVENSVTAKLTAVVRSSDDSPVSVRGYLLGSYTEATQSVAESLTVSVSYASLDGGPSGTFFVMDLRSVATITNDGNGNTTYSYSISTPLQKNGSEPPNELATAVSLPVGKYEFTFNVETTIITNTVVTMNAVLEGVEIPEPNIELTYSPVDKLWYNAIVARDSEPPRKAYYLKRPTGTETGAVTETIDPALPSVGQTWRAGVISWDPPPEQGANCIDARSPNLFSDYRPVDGNQTFWTIGTSNLQTLLTSAEKVTYKIETAVDDATEQCLLSNPVEKTFRSPALLKGQLAGESASDFELIGFVVKP